MANSRALVMPAVDEDRRQKIVQWGEIVGQQVLAGQLQKRPHFAEILWFSSRVAFGPGEGAGMPVAAAGKKIVEIQLLQRAGHDKRVAQGAGVLFVAGEDIHIRKDFPSLPRVL